MKDDLLANLITRETEDKIAFNACGFTLFCDKNASAVLSCRDELEKPIFKPAYAWKTTNIWGNQKCKTTCEHRGGASVFGVKIQDSERTTNTTCDKWERPPPPPKPVKKTPVKKPPVKKTGMSFMNMLAASIDRASRPEFISTSFRTPAAYDDPGASPERESKPVQVNPQDSNITISESALWKVIEGEGGMEHNTLMVVDGEAKAHNFCTGDTVRLTAPNMMTMPTCPQYAGGHWNGAFARPRPKNDPVTTPRVIVPMTLDLKNAKGTLSGEIKTGDGVFTVSGTQSGPNIGIEAVQAGTRAKLNLQGTVTKDSIIFGGSEESAEGVSIYRLLGYLRQLYIADSALPSAVLNEPYNFPLTAFAPGGEALTFRLAVRKANNSAPPGNPQSAVGTKEINWFTNAENLRGRNGERFTFLCPANGTLSGALYGTDAHSDASSICKAAVHAGRIKLQTGGAVMIEIRPNAAAYPATTRNGVLSSTYSYGTGKGSFVFVNSDTPKTAFEALKAVERAPLPRGISFDTMTGTFSGTPTELGRFDLTVTAEDGAGNTYEQPLTFTVKKMTLANGLLHDAFVGQPYSASLNVIGGQAPYRFSTGLPRGLQIDPATGEISGTPTSSILFAGYDVTIRDAQNNAETVKIVLSVRGTTILGSHYLPYASVGAPYRAQFQAIGSASPVIWKAYPTDISLIGLLLNPQTGEISGTPNKAGSYIIQMNAEAGGSVGRSFTLTVE
ncbi:MAG: putative Ig domain-containing protein [Pyrinomonadaceae bacterium]